MLSGLNAIRLTTGRLQVGAAPTRPRQIEFQGRLPLLRTERAFTARGNVLPAEGSFCLIAWGAGWSIAAACDYLSYQYEYLDSFHS